MADASFYLSNTSNDEDVYQGYKYFPRHFSVQIAVLNEDNNFDPYSAGIDFRRQNLTYADVSNV